MEAEMIVSLISSVGFPIVCCFFMWKFIQNTLQDFTKSINENTKTIQKLCDKIDEN